MDPKSSHKFGSGLSGDRVQEFKDVLKGKKDPATEGQEADGADEPADIGNEELSRQLKEIQEQLAMAQEQAKESKEQQLRIMAEFENFRKRMERERDETVKYANDKLIKEFLPVLDHLEMTLTHAPSQTGEKKDPLIQGVELVVKQFIDLLEKTGVQIVEGEGGAFDPHKQEAIGTVPSDEVPAGHVVDVHRKGFMLNGRLIRPALVTVAKEPEETVH